MTQKAPSLSESSEPTKNYKKVFASEAVAISTATGIAPCSVYLLDDSRPTNDTPSTYISIDNLIGEWEKDEGRLQQLKSARQRISNIYGKKKTLRALRLDKGWSQVHLAKLLNTSQSHVARIERGTENLTIDTCRRLCGAHNIDMNTLNDFLKKQEMNLLKSNK